MRLARAHAEERHLCGRTCCGGRRPARELGVQPVRGRRGAQPRRGRQGREPREHTQDLARARGCPGCIRRGGPGLFHDGPRTAPRSGPHEQRRAGELDGQLVRGEERLADLEQRRVREPPRRRSAILGARHDRGAQRDLAALGVQSQRREPGLVRIPARQPRIEAATRLDAREERGLDGHHGGAVRPRRARADAHGVCVWPAGEASRLLDDASRIERQRVANACDRREARVRGFERAHAGARARDRAPRAHHCTSISSTSKTSVALGGIWGGLPSSP